MEENKNENSVLNEVKNTISPANNQRQIAGAIIIAGLLIAGAILLKGNTTQDKPLTEEDQFKNVSVKIEPSDYVLGNLDAKVAIIEYSDFQCPYCEKFYQEGEKTIRENYVATGKVSFVYRDYAFLGEESIKAAEAARCAGNQGKFWEYHDYLFDHQGGENAGNLSTTNLKSFAKEIKLNTADFDQCLDSGKYTEAVANSFTEGEKIGVQATPSTLIVKNGKVIDFIKGAQSSAVVIEKLEKALK